MNLDKEVSIFKGTELKITNESSRAAAIDLIKKAKEKSELVIDFFKDTKSKAHATWKSIVAQEKSFLDKLEDFETLAKKAVGVYDAEKERLRLIQEAELKLKAEDQAEKDRKALQNRAARTKDGEKREELLQKAEAVQPAFVSLPSSVVRQKGESSRKLWYYRIVDLNELEKAFMVPNDSLLKSMAKNEQSRKNPPAGVEFYFETTLSIQS
jgi:hypothetical protein